MNVFPSEPPQPNDLPPSLFSQTVPLPPSEAVRGQVAAHRPIFPAIFRGTILVIAWSITAAAVLHAPDVHLYFASSAFLTLIMTLILAFRINGTTERPLTLLPVVAFSVLMFAGANAVSTAVLAASLLLARIWQRTASETAARQLYHGSVVVLAMAAANRFLTPSLFDSESLPSLVSAACVYTLIYSLLLPLGNIGEWRAWQKDITRPARFRGNILLFLLGLPAAVGMSFLTHPERIYLLLALIAITILSGQLMMQMRRADTLESQINALHDIGNKSIAEDILVDPSALLKKFLCLAKDLIHADRMLIWTMDQDEHFLVAQIGLPDMGSYLNVQAPFAEGLIGHAASKLEPRLIPNAARDPHRRLNESAGGAWMLYPIVVNNRLLGLIQCIRSVHRPFTQEELKRLASLVPHVAVALENIRIREEMHLAASTDGLTSLWNHRKMQQILRNELLRATRYNRALSVLMMDVDSFKTFNDTYGHPAGDQLLRSVAAILQESVRNVDHVGRYGGEEFMVVLPETSKDAAFQLAERIRSAVEERAHIIVKGEKVQRTVSVGVASCPEDALAPSELVQRADEALYRAKRNGKNCVIWA